MEEKLESQLYTNFEVIGKIGEGAFAKVVKAKSKTDKENYAIKIVVLGEDVNVDRELQALIKLDHRNVVKYCSSWQENNNQLFDEVSSNSSQGSIEWLESSASSNCSKQILCIQMELCQGTLKKRLEKVLTSYEILDFLRQMCEGLKHIHSKGIMHRDLKPDNIFISSNNCLKIGDFGLSRALKPTLVVKSESDGPSNSSLPTYGVGTSVYIAPENEVENYRYNEKADIYSLGVIYFEMCHGPFKTQMERFKILENVRQKQIQLPSNLKSKCKGLIRKLLIHDPIRRPSAQEIIHSLPPSNHNLNQFLEKINKNIVPKQTVSSYLRIFTRQANENEETSIDIYQLYRDPQYVTQDALQLCIKQLHDTMKLLEVPYFAVALFLPKSQIYFNVNTEVCLLNDVSANVYGIPYDRRLCYACYLKHCTTALHQKRYSIDAIYEAKKEVYTEITEFNFDIIDGLVEDQIELQFNKLKPLSTLNRVNYPLIINVNHKTLYNETLNYFNISTKDRTILEEYLLQPEVHKMPIDKYLSQKTKISPTTIWQICDTLNGQRRLMKQKKLKDCNTAIEEFILKLRKKGIKLTTAVNEAALNTMQQMYENSGLLPLIIKLQTKMELFSAIAFTEETDINIKPLMVPHHYASGIIYEVIVLQNTSNHLRIVKGSEYKINDSSGAGFSLNLSNVVESTRRIGLTYLTIPKQLTFIK